MRRWLVLFSCLMLLPLNPAQAEVEDLVWWVEYDWTEVDNAADSLVGISIGELVGMVEDAADGTEIELDLQYSLEGKTYLYSRHSGGGNTTVEGGDGVLYHTDVRVTDYAIRHATRATATAISVWDGSKASYDMTASASSTQTAIIDIRISEFVNNDLEIVMIMAESSGILTVMGEVKADGFVAGKADRIDVDNARINYQASAGWSDFRLTWTPDSPLPLYSALDAVEDGGEIRLGCDYHTSYDNQTLRSCDWIEASYNTTHSYVAVATNIPAGALGLGDYWQKVSISDSFSQEEAFEGNFSNNDYYRKAGKGVLNLSGEEREVAFFESELAAPFGLVHLLSLMPLGQSTDDAFNSLGNETARELEDAQSDYDEEKDRLTPIIEDFQYSTFERELERMMERLEDEEINPELDDYRTRYFFVFDTASNRFLMPVVTYAGSEQGELPEPGLGEEIIVMHGGEGIPGLKSGYSSDNVQFWKVKAMQTAQDIMGSQEEIDEKSMIPAPSWLAAATLCGIAAALRRRG